MKKYENFYIFLIITTLDSFLLHFNSFFYFYALSIFFFLYKNHQKKKKKIEIVVKNMKHA